MPKISEPFGDLVRRALHREGDKVSFRKASRMTNGIVSYGAIGDWVQDVVPTDPNDIRLFADALEVPRVPLLIAAEYLPSPDDLESDRDKHPAAVEQMQELYDTLARVKYHRAEDAPEELKAELGDAEGYATLDE